MKEELELYTHLEIVPLEKAMEMVPHEFTISLASTHTGSYDGSPFKAQFMSVPLRNWFRLLSGLISQAEAPSWGQHFEYAAIISS